MTLDAWITLATIAVMVLLMARDVLSPPAAVVAATGFLFAIGVIESEAALSGLSNPAPIAVGGLYVVAGAVERTGLLAIALGGVLGDGIKPRRSLGRLLVPSSGISAFMANTPIVAMLVPAIVQWADSHRVSASRFLLPLSYATILGGTLTVIGTSTNLVASGLSADAGMGSFGLFSTGALSWPIVIVGLILIVFLAPTVVPPRRRPATAETGDRPLTITMEVRRGGALDGKTVASAGLRDLEGVYLVEITRGDTVVAPVAPDRRLSGADQLVFAGDLARVLDLQSLDGLDPVTDDRDLPPVGSFHEGVVGPTSGLVGRTLSNSGFRGRHQAAVVAIHRAGEQVMEKLGGVIIRPGDTLLLLTGPDFDERSPAVREDFMVITHLGEVSSPEQKKWNRVITIAALAVVVVFPALNVTTVLRAVVIAIGMLIATRVLRPRDVWELVDLNVVAMIGAAFGLGRAVSASGLADVIADGIIDTTKPLGQIGAILGILLTVMILTELVTNAAAVALVFPTALVVAADIGVDPKTMVIGIAVASSSSFLTPIGYQTNTMVWGPGRYQFTDYLRLGIPLWFVSWVGVSLMVSTVG